jgi:hypothetical protein
VFEGERRKNSCFDVFVHEASYEIVVELKLHLHRSVVFHDYARDLSHLVIVMKMSQGFLEETADDIGDVALADF